MHKDTPLYFISPYNKYPTGGVKQIYRQVDHLNTAGFKAFVVHPKNGQRSNWFQNTTKILYNERIFITRKLKLKKKIKLYIRAIFGINNDPIDINGILIIPEIYGNDIQLFNPEMKYVVFNQNCYYTFNDYSYQNTQTPYPYHSNRHLATLVVSEDSKNYLNFAFPDAQIHRITLGIDPKTFCYHSVKKKQIAFMPRKLSNDIIQIINIIKARNKIPNWEFIPIDNKSETEVSSTLKESALFMSTNHKEGFGLPPAEAMACGCIVIGYSGQGGQEYFKEKFSYPITEGEIINFAKQVENIAMAFEKQKNNIQEKGKNAATYINTNYSLELEQQNIINTWKSILKIAQS